ncbi:hypothetical protein [Novosphingobium sp. PY1]|uniref:AbiTii domain-containing protein n=1 Tax=Novosphingobium sp. PY1 TaxID=1882221 RepID=UPI001A9027B6|nr:hypothetical protein [Novosphingobium sp. PY1]GFM27185.1 uncharacterized protein PY1_contig-01-46 [Novosphingobium sp. PY1]
MAGLVEEIQALALDPTVNVADLLRRVKLAAVKLNLQDAIEWVDSELNGYVAVDSIPSYRHITGRVMVHDPYKGLYPLAGNSRIIDKLGKAPLRESISALEEVTSGENSDLMVPLPRGIVEKINNSNGGYHCDINNHITKSSVVAVIDHVRNLVLEWSLALEQEGILGEGISFSKEEKKLAKESHLTINNYGHFHQGDTHGHQNKTVIGSTDNSTNTISTENVFQQVIDAVNSSIGNENDRREIVELVEAMQSAQGTADYKPLFQKWVGYLADYATVLGPFLPAFSNLAG